MGELELQPSDHPTLLLHLEPLLEEMLVNTLMCFEKLQFMNGMLKIMLNLKTLTVEKIMVLSKKW